MNIPLLHRLRAAQGEFVPLAELAGRVEDAQRDLAELETFGYAIECHPFRGAAYRGPAERLCPDQIEYDLNTRCIGRRIAVWERVTSTNDLAARASGSLANEGLVVLAEDQSAGRGRRGRAWTVPARSSVLMSVLLFPPPELAEAGWLTALGAVAVAEVVAEWTGREARIKWPNDVRIDGLKIAGVLVERGPGAVIGIGVNANVATFPDDLRATATSLHLVTGAPVDRSELVRALIVRLDAWYELGRSRGPETLNAPWRDRSEHLGRPVRVQTPLEDVRGRLEDLDLRQGITLRGEDSMLRRIACPEVLTLANDLEEPAG